MHACTVKVSLNKSKEQERDQFGEKKYTVRQTFKLTTCMIIQCNFLRNLQIEHARYIIWNSVVHGTE